MVFKIYNLLIYFFDLLAPMMALFDQKLKKGIKGRQDFVDIAAKASKVRYWIHCASLGEFEQGRPIIEKLRENENAEIILSFFSPSGYDVKKDYPLADNVCYIPFDTKNKVNNFLERIEPDIAIFVKYEFWWNMIKCLLDHGTPLIFISAAFDKNHYIFRNWAEPFRRLLQRTNHIFVIDQASTELLEKNGFINASLSGDTRIESILNRSKKNTRLTIIEKFKGDNPLLIFGSTYPSEHHEIIKNADDLIEHFQILIFPHEINAKEITDLKNALGKKCQLYSEIEKQHPFSGHSILIVDKIGFLADAYQYADIAYVGGGFDHGIHNILEPFVYMIPLVFGPEHRKFPEAIFLETFEFSAAIEKLSQLKSGIQEAYQCRNSEQIETAYYQLFDNNSQVSNKIVQYINKLI